VLENNYKRLTIHTDTRMHTHAHNVNGLIIPLAITACTSWSRTAFLTRFDVTTSDKHPITEPQTA